MESVEGVARMDNNLYEILKHCNNADEYFFSRHNSYIQDVKDGSKLTFRQGMKSQSTIGGVRLNEWDPTGADPNLEQICQYDLSHMVGSLIEVRKQDGYGSFVLSNEHAIAYQQQNQHGKRVKFGLQNSTNDHFADDQYAAKHCYHNIKRAIHRSGFSIVHPKTFDPATGMNGLHQWAEAVRLQRKRMWLPWLLLLLPLLLLFFLPSCENFSLLDMNLRSQSFVLIIDRSGSMNEEIEYVRLRMDIFLDELIGNSSYWQKYYGDVITYTNTADSALGGIKEIDESVSNQLQHYLSNVDAGGDTWLKSAIDLAADEIAEHQKPTTIFIITDAEGDDSIQQMINREDELRRRLSGVDIYMNSTTPRIISATGPMITPNADGETVLKKLSETFDGVFGRMGKG